MIWVNAGPARRGHQDCIASRNQSPEFGAVLSPGRPSSSAGARFFRIACLRPRAPSGAAAFLRWAWLQALGGPNHLRVKAFRWTLRPKGNPGDAFELDQLSNESGEWPPEGMLVLSPFLPSEAEPAAGHPCFGCAVRERAVCGVLDCEALGTFKRMGHTVRLKPGQALFHEGDPARQVFTVTRGSVKLYRLLSDGRRQVTAFLFPGDFLGLGPDAAHELSAEAMDDVQLCAFPRGRFGDFVDAHPRMERQLYCLAARRLGAAGDQMMLLGRKTALERLASFFVQLQGRAARNGRDGRFVDLPMSRSDIADYLGLTKETVSRLLARLRARRLIRLAAIDRVEILDPAGLAHLAEDAGESRS